MEKMRVLLVCGSGASSGFMATNMRKVVTERNLDISIIARSEAEVENYIDDIDVIMVGPHLAYIVDDLLDFVTKGTNVKVILMKQSYYSKLDGALALDHLLDEMKK